MEKHEFVVDISDAGERLDVFLVENFKHKFSRSFIKKLVDKGNIEVNNKRPKAHYMVQAEDRLLVEIPQPEQLNVEPQNIPIDIVFEDRDIVVVNKQAGLVVHPSPGNYKGTLVNALLFHCRDLSGIGGTLRPGIVHRLDKDTSGLMVVAKSDLAHRSLASQFQSKKATRIYIALVRGIVQLDNGVIEQPIGRHPMDRKRMGITSLKGKNARTLYKVLERFKDFTKIELRLETGRTHQIRVHMAHLGHPTLGDRTYGYSKGLNRQALHAQKLYFFHPRTKKGMEFESQLPQDMLAVIKRGRI